ncbi:MAG TPA: DNA alkylation repair protein [Terriglobales bacterium]|nr:DNA alkylation repair protein [Terriglobales bacterium]
MRSPANLAKHIRKLLRDYGSPEHAAGVQHFFQEEVRSHGWRAADLRNAAVRMRRAILAHAGPDYLLQVADRLFRGRVLEEKVMAVLLLEKSLPEFGGREFRQLESWLDRVTTWADHDSLVHILLGPLLVAEPRRAKSALRWAKSQHVWHRRAAAVVLIYGARREMFEPEIRRVAQLLLRDENLMVQKGLGWLLREWGKKSPQRATPFLLKMRRRAPRLVLRTACEKLSQPQRAKILALK